MKIPFSWIEQGNTDQLEWASKYLARKEVDSSLPGWLRQHLKQDGGPLTATMLKSVPKTADFRELSEMMKGAWKTRQNRKKYGNPVSLQMPKATQEQLKSLAKKHKQSQAKTLSQIISEASDNQKLATAQSREEQKKFRGQLDKQQKQAQQIEQVYQDVVNSLLDALAEEVNYRCRLEAFVGEWEDSPLGSKDKQKYLSLVEKRVLEVEPVFTKLKMRRINIDPSLSERIQAKSSLDDSVKNIEVKDALADAWEHMN